MEVRGRHGVSAQGTATSGQVVGYCCFSWFLVFNLLIDLLEHSFLPVLMFYVWFSQDTHGEALLGWVPSVGYHVRFLSRFYEVQVLYGHGIPDGQGASGMKPVLFMLDLLSTSSRATTRGLLLILDDFALGSHMRRIHCAHLWLTAAPECPWSQCRGTETSFPFPAVRRWTAMCGNWQNWWRTWCCAPGRCV
jgi:hypothetical protein